MFIHTPELCYPAAGFEPAARRRRAAGRRRRGGRPVPFRSLAFAKGEGGLADDAGGLLQPLVRRPMDHRGRRARRRRSGSRDVQGAGLAGGSRPASGATSTTPASRSWPALVGEIEARMAGGRPAVDARPLSIGARPTSDAMTRVAASCQEAPHDEPSGPQPQVDPGPALGPDPRRRPRRPRPSPTSRRSTPARRPAGSSRPGWSGGPSAATGGRPCCSGLAGSAA